MSGRSKHSRKKSENLKRKSKSQKRKKTKSSAKKKGSSKKRLSMEEKHYEYSELESSDEKKKLISRILEIYPDERLDLKFSSPFELLVSAIFAAQARDEVVNLATEKLFQKYKNPEDFANLKPEDLKDYVSKINFWYKKAQTVINASREIIEKYQGKVPDSVDELMKIKGIGRKTANMVVGGAYGKPAIIVDTHVMRVSQRLGLVDEGLTPEEIEFKLKGIVPEEDQTKFSFALIRHGKKVCHAKNPECQICDLKNLCRWYKTSFKYT